MGKLLWIAVDGFIILGILACLAGFVLFLAVMVGRWVGRLPLA